MRILIVDDSESDRHIYQRLLIAAFPGRLTISQASTGTDALAVCRSGEFDCVLLDYRLNDMSGLDVLERLVDRGEPAPVVMLTECGDESLAAAAMRGGAHDYLAKSSLSSPALATAVRRAIERHTFAQSLAERHRELKHLLEGARAEANAKSEFLATMTHEIRTPLNGILGMVNLLAGFELPDDQREYVDTIVSSAESLLVLINDVLDFSRLDAGRFRIEYIEFEPRRVLRDVVALLATKAEEKRVTVETTIDERVPKVLVGDPTRVRQILMNLIGNAIKFTDGGKVGVHVTGQVVDGALNLRCEVADTGIGIEPVALKGLFQRFSQADTSTTRRFGGSGLGLAISRQLCELMGGSIGVESTPGVGSRFWFTVRQRLSTATEAPQPDLSRASVLVSTAQAAPASVPDSQAVTELSSTTTRTPVLVVDDNAINRRVAARHLEKLGYRVDTVEDGAQAVEAVQQRRYGLVLMDCHMPVLDGFAATAQIRQLTGDAARLPIVAATANNDPAARDACLRAGMNDCLVKPFRTETLQHVIDTWFGRGIDKAA